MADPDHDYFNDYTEFDIYKTIYRASNDLNIFLQFFTVIMNILHLIVLLQKELRCGAIYILMIGICFADILNFLLDFYDVGFERAWWTRYILDFNTYCADYTYAVINPIYLFNNTLVLITRPVAVWLSILMALIRTLSVYFPMSTWINNLTKSKTVVKIIVLVYAFWFVFYTCNLVFYKIVWYPNILRKR